MLIFIIFPPICNNLGHRGSPMWQSTLSFLQLEITCADTGTQTHIFETYLSFKTFLWGSVVEESVHTYLHTTVCSMFFKGHCSQPETNADSKKVTLYKWTHTCLSFHFLLIYTFIVTFFLFFLFFSPFSTSKMLHSVKRDLIWKLGNLGFSSSDQDISEDEWKFQKCLGYLVWCSAIDKRTKPSCV